MYAGRLTIIGLLGARVVLTAPITRPSKIEDRADRVQPIVVFNEVPFPEPFVLTTPEQGFFNAGPPARPALTGFFGQKFFK